MKNSIRFLVSILILSFMSNNGLFLRVSPALADAVQLKIDQSYANWQIEGNQASIHFGRTISSAGDVNGDSFRDLLVAEPYYSTGDLTGAGRIEIFYGSAAGLHATADWQTTGTQEGEYLGFSVSTAGDVNGDGYDDLLLGRQTYSDIASNAGRVDLYYGAENGLSGTPGWSATGTLAGALFGYSTHPAGDVNGDGYDDIAIYASNQNESGSLYVFHGSASGPMANATQQDADWHHDGSLAQGKYGFITAYVDANKDGYSDLIVKENFCNTPDPLPDCSSQEKSTTLFFYLGSPSGLGNNPLTTWQSIGTGEYYGKVLDASYDLTGDGYPDLLVSHQIYSNSEVGEGGVFLFPGDGQSFASTPAWTFQTNQFNAVGGWGLASPGDVNGDGYNDVVIAAAWYDDGQTDEGAIFVYLGSADGLREGIPQEADWIIESDSESAQLGNLVGLGDVNQDGLADFAAGAENYSNGETLEGEVLVFHGAAPGKVTNCQRPNVMGGLEMSLLTQQPIIQFLCSGTINLRESITISNSIEFDGGQQNVTLSGQDQFRLFTVNTGAQLTLKHLTLANGKVTAETGTTGTAATSNSGSGTGGPGGNASGGAIYNDGTVIAHEVNFSNNQAVAGKGGRGGAGYYYRYCGWFSCSTTLWYGGYGGVGGNAYGGAIYNHGGTLTIEKSSFVDNKVKGGAGGPPGYSAYNYENTFCAGNGGNAYGGAIFSTGGILTIGNSTFSTNLANGGSSEYSPNMGCYYSYSGYGYGGAISTEASGPAAFIQFSTIKDNTVNHPYRPGDYSYNAPLLGGGLYNNGSTVQLIASLLDNNIGYYEFSNPGQSNCLGTINSFGSNLSSDGTCNLSGENDRNSTPAQLGSLGNYGGLTFTFPLLPGSPAIDIGSSISYTVDQRGVTRPQGSAVDSGAFELEQYRIAGNTGISQATLSYTNGTPKEIVSDTQGDYSFFAFPGWSGTVTPTKTGYTFSPAERTFTNVMADLPGQNFTATPITYTISGNTGTGQTTLSYTDGAAKTVTSDSDGTYAITVSYNWSGTVTAAKTGYIFTPTERIYTDVLADQTDQNFTATPITYTISGNTGIGGVTLSYTDGTPKTATSDGSGNYAFIVSYNWSGIVTPTKTGFLFSPTELNFTNILSNQTDQDFTAIPVYTISGNTGVSGVTLSYTDGAAKTATSDNNGNYSFTVSYQWSGVVTPTKTGYTFSPPERTYTNVQSDQTDQNFSATLTTFWIYLPIVIR